MSKTAALTSGVLGGATTMLTRTGMRKALHTPNGAPRLPRRVQQHGVATMLLCAAAAGVLLALADVLLEQRRHSAERDPYS